jgi:hypothetical protein
MPFSEIIKKEVRQRAAFRCCRCQKIGIEVHHIIPEEHGGPDARDNAAPLCPNCHADFGANPEKRKAIFEMRDWWYGRVKEMYGSPVIPTETIEELNENIIKWGKGLSDFKAEIKPLLERVSQTMIEMVTPSTATEALSGVISMTIPPLGIYSAGHSMVACGGCGNLVELENYCPKCGTKLK